MIRPDTILYVDDEAMALKYFERLVRPFAPVLTAGSVEEGRALLAEHAGRIAVLISDQRMPGAYGNELLRHAREHHPGIVRMLTTAYSELGEAIEAINSGEIYRYVTKPWDIDILKADLRNALELATLRNERDGLLREKMLVQQQQLLSQRVGHLAVAAAGFVRPGFAPALYAYLDTALQVGAGAPGIDWHALDHADLAQLEAQRAIAIGQLLARWEPAFGSGADTTDTLAALAQALPGAARVEGSSLVVTDRRVFTWPLEAPTRETPSAASVAWLAWQLWRGQPAQVQAEGDAWRMEPLPASALPVLPDDWMADCIERLGESRDA
jgi:two-component system probable response regulator PhcQ